MIYVTHDQIEALTFADQVVVMHEGQIVQTGTPVELFEKPKHTFVGHFIGSPGMNILPCEIKNGQINFEGKILPTNASIKKTNFNKTQVGIRPEFIHFSNDGIQVGGLFAVNSYGSTVNNETGQFWAATDETENEFGGMGVPTFAPNDVLSGTATRETLPGQNTTIGVIATNVKLDSKAAKRIAIMAHSGMSRAIRPIHSPVDGDVIFVISTGTLNKELSLNDINTIGELGARVCSRSIARGIYEADSILGIKSWREVYE